MATRPSAFRRIWNWPATQTFGQPHLCVSLVVASELRSGYEKSGSLRLSRGIERFLNRVEILSYEPPADLSYARIRAFLERNGNPIGRVDLFIAAHALDLPLITNNIREFSGVENLKLENGLEEPRP